MPKVPLCESGERRWLHRSAAASLILGAAALRLWFLLFDCPFDLAPDEAHYWEWSRRLDWSYYSKGPLVAWLIHLSCRLAGDWSIQMTGSEMAAVRLPAVVCGGLLLAGLYTLTVQVYRKETLALAVVALALTLPVIAAGSTIMTIDAPYTCCWCWALVLGYQAVFRRSRWAWAVLGFVVGLGILAKYTMVLWWISLLVFLLFSHPHRSLLRRPGLWISGALSALCCFPIVVWNIQHDWVSARHVGHLAGSRATGEIDLVWWGPLTYVIVQFALFLGFWFVAWARAMWHHRPWKDADAPKNYLWWMSCVTFAVFFVFSFTTKGGEANWPVTTYLSGMVLAAGWMLREWQAARGWYKQTIQLGVIGFAILGAGLTILVHNYHLLYPALDSIVSRPTPDDPIPIRRLDPTCRLRGWRTLAAAVDQTVNRLRQAGVEPIVVTGFWNVPGELKMYCRSKPEVHSLGVVLGSRRSQHDLWRPNPVFDPHAFRGRTFVYVGDGSDFKNHQESFARFETPRRVVHRQQQTPLACWEIMICRRFRGFSKDPKDNKKY